MYCFHDATVQIVSILYETESRLELTLIILHVLVVSLEVASIKPLGEPPLIMFSKISRFSLFVNNWLWGGKFWEMHHQRVLRHCSDVHSPVHTFSYTVFKTLQTPTQPKLCRNSDISYVLLVFKVTTLESIKYSFCFLQFFLCNLQLSIV